MTLAEARPQEDPPTVTADETTAPVEAEEYEEYDDEPEVTDTDTRMGKGFGVIAAAALIVALASAVTAGATVFYILESTTRSEERTAQLVAALKEPQSYALQGSAGATNQSGAVQGAQPGQPGAAAAQPGQPGAQAQAGGAQPGAASAGGATQGQQGAQPQAQPGAASAGGAAQGQAAPAAPQAAAPAQQAAPQQAAPAAPAAPAPAASAPMPSADLLLQTTMAAAQPGVPGAELAKRTVDGPVTAGTLEQVAAVRSRMAPPPGMEAMGDIVKFDVRDVVVTGDTATATMTIIWPAGWGEWTYPNSGFQYVDGEWKLQKSTVCNLASAAWVNCY